MNSKYTTQELIDKMSLNDIAQAVKYNPSLSLTDGFLIRDRNGEKSLVVQADNISASKEYMLSHSISSLEVNMSLGYPKLTVEWLKDFIFLTKLVIIHQPLRNTNEINLLHNLEELELNCYFYSSIDFNNFPKLNRCYLHWTRNAINLFQQKQLRSLTISYYAGINTNDFGELINLKELKIIHSPLEDISALSKIQQLKSLELSLMPKLGSLQGIEALKNLEQLELTECNKLTSLVELKDLIKLKTLIINGCKKINEINNLRNLINLTYLSISNDGSIASLQPIRLMHHLEKLFFIEDTNILDGDLTPVLALKNIKTILFMNRKHYTHKRILQTNKIVLNSKRT